MQPKIHGNQSGQLIAVISPEHKLTIYKKDEGLEQVFQPDGLFNGCAFLPMNKTSGFMTCSDEGILCWIQTGDSYTSKQMSDLSSQQIRLTLFQDTIYVGLLHDNAVHIFEFDDELIPIHVFRYIQKQPLWFDFGPEVLYTLT